MYDAIRALLVILAAGLAWSLRGEMRDAGASLGKALREQRDTYRERVEKQREQAGQLTISTHDPAGALTEIDEDACWPDGPCGVYVPPE